MKVRGRLGLIGMVLALLLAACGDDAGDANPETTSGESATGETTATTAPSAPQASGDAGFVTIGDETIEFESARCFLEAQDAAGGGGQILAVGQGFGTNADGEEIALDFTRFDEDSQFTGDDVSITIGDPFSGSAVSLEASLDLGGVSIDGRTLSADGFTFTNWDDFSETPGAFELNC